VHDEGKREKDRKIDDERAFDDKRDDNDNKGFNCMQYFASSHKHLFWYKDAYSTTNRSCYASLLNYGLERLYLTSIRKGSGSEPFDACILP
jgi:hypothetical protein